MSHNERDDLLEVLLASKDAVEDPEAPSETVKEEIEAHEPGFGSNDG
jgi:hypothetical protein